MASEPTAFLSEPPEPISAWVKPELEPGERLLWAGSPIDAGRVGRIVYPTAVVWVIGLGSLSAACGWMFCNYQDRLMALGFDAPVAITGFFAGLVAFFAFLGLLSQGWSRGEERRRIIHQTYAITDRRVIVWQPSPGSQAVEIRSFPRGMVKSIRRLQQPDGSGDVLFEVHGTTAFPPPAFRRVADVRRVEDILRQCPDVSFTPPATPPPVEDGLI